MHEAALALAPSAVFQLPGDTTQGFRFFAELARRLPAFRVRLSEDPVEIADAIGSFLAREQAIPVSVIMPALNAGRFIEAALRSLLRERDAVALDIIVIDDGSTDETRDIVKAIAGDFPEVRLLQNPRKGIAAARNTGLEHIRETCRLRHIPRCRRISYPGPDRAAAARFWSTIRGIDVLYGAWRCSRRSTSRGMRAGRGKPDEDHPRTVPAVLDVSRSRSSDSVGRFDESFRQGDDTDYRAAGHRTRAQSSCSTTGSPPITAATTPT